MKLLSIILVFLFSMNLSYACGFCSKTYLNYNEIALSILIISLILLLCVAFLYNKNHQKKKTKIEQLNFLPYKLAIIFLLLCLIGLALYTLLFNHFPLISLLLIFVIPIMLIHIPLYSILGYELLGFMIVVGLFYAILGYLIGLIIRNKKLKRLLKKR